MMSRPRSQRRMPSSADRSRPSRLLAFIAARSVAPSPSVPILAIAGSITATLAPTLSTVVAMARPPTEPVGAVAGAVGAGIVLSPAAQSSVGAAAGEVGAGIVLSTAAQPSVGAAAGEVGAGIALGV